jgi:ammonia channel protein AmtB
MTVEAMIAFAKRMDWVHLASVAAGIILALILEWRLDRLREKNKIPVGSTIGLMITGAVILWFMARKQKELPDGKPEN